MAPNAPSKFRLIHLPKLLKETVRLWLAKDPFNLSAIVAYYAILSLPAFLILLLVMVGGIWGREIVAGQLTSEISIAFGPDTAAYIKEIISQKGDEATSVLATILGVGTLLYGATGVFYQLQNALDKIWEAQTSNGSGLMATLFGRLKSFGFILIFGFLLLISLALTSLMAAFSSRINRMLPDGFLEFAFIVEIAFSLGFIYLLFAAMFKYLPSTPIPWKAVKVGALLTSIFFIMGKYLLAFYFAEAEPGSTYGAAGSIVLVMLWVSYTSLILFFGAQFTKVYSDTYLTPLQSKPT